MGGSGMRGRLGEGPVPSRPALARLGRVRKTWSKLEELPTLLERTQGKEQREDEELHRTRDVWMRTRRKFCKDRRRGGVFFFLFDLNITSNLSFGYTNIFFTHGRKSVDSATDITAMWDRRYHNILRYCSVCTAFNTVPRVDCSNTTTTLSELLSIYLFTQLIGGFHQDAIRRVKHFKSSSV